MLKSGKTIESKPKFPTIRCIFSATKHSKATQFMREIHKKEWNFAALTGKILKEEDTATYWGMKLKGRGRECMYICMYRCTYRLRAWGGKQCARGGGELRVRETGRSVSPWVCRTSASRPSKYPVAFLFLWSRPFVTECQSWNDGSDLVEFNRRWNLTLSGWGQPRR